MNTHLRLRSIMVLFLLALGGIEPSINFGQERPELLSKYAEEATKKWEAEIRKLEALDLKDQDPAGAILLLGSSSIRLWDTVANDLAPYPIISRGYGGARFSDLAVFAERLMKPHSFRAIVMFVGNDVTGEKTDKSPDEVVALVHHIRSVARTHQPQAPVFILEVTPTPKRFKVWNEIRAVNAALREYCLTTPLTYFIATAEDYLTPDDQPRSELFREDKLHQNADGYKRWTVLIKRKLDDVLQARSASE